MPPLGPPLLLGPAPLLGLPLLPAPCCKAGAACAAACGQPLPADPLLLLLLLLPL